MLTNKIFNASALIIAVITIALIGLKSTSSVFDYKFKHYTLNIRVPNSSSNCLYWFIARRYSRGANRSCYSLSKTVESSHYR